MPEISLLVRCSPLRPYSRAEDVGCKSLQTRRDLASRRARLWPPHYLQPSPSGRVVPVQEAVRAVYYLFGTQRQRDFRGIAHLNTRESPLGHANYLEWVILDRDRLTQDITVCAIFAFPKSIAQDGHTRAPTFVIARRQHPADRRTDAQSVEIIARNKLTTYFPSFASLREIEWPASVSEDSREHVLTVPQPLPNRVAEVCLRRDRYLNQLFWMATGRDRSITALIRLNIAVLAPIPRAKIESPHRRIRGWLSAPERHNACPATSRRPFYPSQRERQDRHAGDSSILHHFFPSGV